MWMFICFLRLFSDLASGEIILFIIVLGGLILIQPVHLVSIF